MAGTFSVTPICVASPQRRGWAIPAVKTNRAKRMFQSTDGRQQCRPFAETEESGDIWNSRRRSRVLNFNQATLRPIINNRGGEHGVFIFGKGTIRPRHKSRQRRERSNNHPPPKLRLDLLPALHGRRPVWM